MVTETLLLLKMMIYLISLEYLKKWERHLDF